MARTRQWQASGQELFQKKKSSALNVPSSSDSRVKLRRADAGFFTPAEILTPRKKLYAYNKLLGQLEDARLNHNLIKEKEGYYRLIASDVYIEYFRIEAVKVKKTGWKLHISLQPESLKTVWPHLYPLLLRHVDCFKVTRPDYLQEHLSSSKQITIYQLTKDDINKSEDDWYAFLYDIERVLKEYDCVPGVISPANKMITGSQFISYRNDTHPQNDNTYIGDVGAENYARMHNEIEAFNLVNAPDPFASINVATKMRMQPFDY